MFHFQLAWYCLLNFISNNLEQLLAIYYLWIHTWMYFSLHGNKSSPPSRSFVVCNSITREKIPLSFSSQQTRSVIFASNPSRTTLALLLFNSCTPVDSCLFSWESQDPRLSSWLGRKVPRTPAFHCLHGFPKAFVHLQGIYYHYTLYYVSPEAIRRVTDSNYWGLLEKLKK